MYPCIQVSKYPCIHNIQVSTYPSIQKKISIQDTQSEKSGIRPSLEDYRDLPQPRTIEKKVLKKLSSRFQAQSFILSFYLK